MIRTAAAWAFIVLVIGVLVSLGQCVERLEARLCHLELQVDMERATPLTRVCEEWDD